MTGAKRRGGASRADRASTPEDDCLPMTAGALGRAMGMVNDALRGPDRPDLSGYSVPLDLAFKIRRPGVVEDLSEAARRDLENVALKNTPLNRAVFAILRLTGPDRKRFAGTWTRVFATAGRLHDEEARRWTRVSAGSTAMDVHRVVLEAAGSMALVFGGEFDREAFWRGVERRAAVAG